jgi:hypothetical protein
MIKFANTFKSNTNSEPKWLDEWWQKFGLNPSAVHPDIIDNWQFMNQTTLSKNVHRLSQISNESFMRMFIMKIYLGLYESSMFFNKRKTTMKIQTYTMKFLHNARIYIDITISMINRSNKGY